MLDIKWIRQNPTEFDMAMKSRNFKITASDLLQIDEKRRGNIFLIQELQAKRNNIAKEIAKEKSSGNNIDNLLLESKKINSQLTELESLTNQDDELSKILSEIPNILQNSVPIGLDETNNVEVEKHGEPRQFNFQVKSHFEIGENLGMLDFEQSALMSGARFSTLSYGLAKLERALSNFMLDIATQNGYIEVSPPNLVKDKGMYNSGQLPKFHDEAFNTKDGYWLIPTAEVSLVNLVANKTLKAEDLPLRFTAYTPCFRREAGSAGKDTRGMIRQHQFKKVELVSITTEEQSDEEHNRMTNIACEILKKLELPYRKILLCSGDIGFCANKTFDLEVWLPSQNQYREISSCSNCGDFQARRANIKYKKDNKTHLAHTLNGSSLAVGRTIVAILENYQNADGSVTIPKALIPYFGAEILRK